MKTTRDFEPADRYTYDWGLCSAKNGFAQVDTEQDAWYFGTWANPIKLCILTYCEGDVTLRQAESEYEFVAAMRQIVAWNQEAGWEFKGIDPMGSAAIESRFKTLGLADLLH